jgi:hypothetical protein
MKKILHFVLVFFAVIEGNSQVNLVLNPSFEEFSVCPDDENQVDRAIGWQNFLLTPDYFNSCSNNINFSTPNNLYGSHQNPSSGYAYAGVYTYYSAWPWSFNNREYIAYEFISPLIIGKKYFISFKTSLAFNNFSAVCATNNLGAKLTMNNYTIYGSDSVNSPLTNNFAHINHTEIIVDTINWTEISGEVTADSNYRFLVIGNFFDDNNTDSISFVQANTCESYYYIDDVMINEVNENSLTKKYININYYQNGNELIFENFENYTVEIQILSIEGKKLYSKQLFVNNKFNLSSLSSGYYYIIFITEKGMYSKKIIIN